MPQLKIFEPKIFWIDLFCGGGGTTTGIHMARANAIVVGCVNHDQGAINDHEANHPFCVHLTEDVKDFQVILKLKAIIDELRKENPGCIINIWASLECTHFSKAKGGLARDADSRTLANSMFKYLTVLDADYLYVENVMEFLTWGPLDKKGQPIKKLKGIDYRKWRDTIIGLGYNYEYMALNAADFGAYTSRERYFGVFAKKGLPIRFPVQTHIKRSKLKDTNLKPWKPVKDVLQFEVEGRSVFGKTLMGKDYSENTLKRIYAGLLKFGKDGLFIKRYNGGNPKHKSSSINSPLGTILTNRTHALVKSVFLTSYYGNGNAHSIDEPCNTLTTKDRYAAHFISYDYSNGGKGNHSSIETAAGTITQVPKHKLVKAHFTFDTQFSNPARSLDEPGQTLIARMDKNPVYLTAATYKGLNQQQEKKGDNDTVKLIRGFMREYEILDITIRMLTIPELKAIQGFPADYELTGSKASQLKSIGNSVVPLMAQRLVEANDDAIREHLVKLAA